MYSDINGLKWFHSWIESSVVKVKFCDVNFTRSSSGKHKSSEHLMAHFSIILFRCRGWSFLRIVSSLVIASDVELVCCGIACWACLVFLWLIKPRIDLHTLLHWSHIKLSSDKSSNNKFSKSRSISTVLLKKPPSSKTYSWSSSCPASKSPCLAAIFKIMCRVSGPSGQCSTSERQTIENHNKRPSLPDYFFFLWLWFYQFINTHTWNFADTTLSAFGTN